MARNAQIQPPVVLSFIMLAGLLAYVAFQGLFDSEGWRKPEYITRGFIIFFVGCSVMTIARGFLFNKRGADAERADRLATLSRTVEDRLDALERLKRRDMVTPEEYAAKRQEILKDL